MKSYLYLYNIYRIFHSPSVQLQVQTFEHSCVAELEVLSGCLGAPYHNLATCQWFIREYDECLKQTKQ